jgi:hypothetical protein
VRRPYAALVQVRDPVPRSLDIVAAELFLAASQAFLVGVLMYLAVGIWDDRGVGFGPVAITLAGLGLAIGGAWLYWLSGGVGWPLAAANVPAAIFLGFSLILGWQGGDIVRVEGVPLLLSLAASVYGLICGVFLDPPRRRRWDQRQRPRSGSSVPRISPTTQALVSRVPRSLPRRSTVPPQGFASLRQGQAGAPASVGQPTSAFDVDEALEALSTEDESDDEDGTPAADTPAAAGGPTGGTMTADAPASAAAAVAISPAGTVTALPASPAASPAMPTERLDRAARAASTDASEPLIEEPMGIELPTSLEPKAQRSPWAWAAPPEWTRDEDDDEPPAGRSAGRPSGRA